MPSEKRYVKAKPLKPHWKLGIFKNQTITATGVEAKETLRFVLNFLKEFYMSYTVLTVCFSNILTSVVS